MSNDFGNFRSEEAKMLNPEEPIFCHPNGRFIGSFKKGFEQVLNEDGVDSCRGPTERSASPTFSGTPMPR